MKQVVVEGYTAPGFDRVKTEFERNFNHRGDTGAACAIYYRGEKVVDLWGGFSRGIQPWQQGTMVLVFSATKGFAAMALAKLHSQGLLDYQERISTYWPEFAQEGKGDITLRQLLTHQAGLVLLDQRLPVTKLDDLDATAGILARAKPLWQPGKFQGYHAGTIGFYLGELLRRIDSKKRSLGQYFQEEIAAPLGLDFYIGLPDEIPGERVAQTQMINPLLAPFNLGKMPPGLRSAAVNPLSLFMKSATIIKGYHPNQRKTWRVEQPSGNGIGTARSAAFLYGLLAQGGEKLGLTPATFNLLNELPELPWGGTVDKVMNMETRYGLGFMKPDPVFSFSANPRAFGFLGATGTFAFADPESQLGFAYFTRKMGYYGVNDPREKSLREAAYTCINGLGK